MASILWKRDITSQVDGVKHTLSSWDNCMSKAYCKWPVIIAIVVVGCILLSIIFCVARCLCCGAECACCCFRCCASCCPSPSRKNKRAQSPTYGGPGPSYASRPFDTQYRSHAAPVYEPPQYAQFDNPSKPINEDALPAMPSWGDATSKKVEDEHAEDVELNHLDKDGTAAATVPMLTSPAGTTPIRSPGKTVQQDEYGFPGAYSNQNLSQANSMNRQPSPAHTNSYNSYNSYNPEQETGVYHDDHSSGYGQAFSTNQASNPGGYRGVSRSPVSPYRDQYSPTTAAAPYPTAPRRSPQPQQPSYQDYNRSNPSLSPGYAPSGSTRYEPSNMSYGAQNMHLPQQPRRSPNTGWHTNSGSGQPMNGWRDV